jgi:hypothetical protein
MIIQALCDECGQWLAPRLFDLCVDCALNLCPACAGSTGHRLTHEDAGAWEAELRPQGWDYLRCATTPYSIHAETVALMTEPERAEGR